MPELARTIIFAAPWDVDRRLSELHLTRTGLMTVRAVAMNERANATPFHPSNAPGTFAYQHGSWSLRDQFVGPHWVADCFDGVECIRCDELKIRIAFSNVDIACNKFHDPKPRSRKGAGAERASNASLFGDLPQFAPVPRDGWALYYFMLDVEGAVELTRPVVKGGSFYTPIERIYLSFGEDDDGAFLTNTDGDIDDNFDPQIARL